MQGLHDLTQLALQILRDPAWSGVAGICALIGIPIAFLLARQPKINRPQRPRSSKENQTPRLVSSNRTKAFIRDGYHRATLAKELVKDIDILVVVDTKKLAS